MLGRSALPFATAATVMLGAAIAVHGDERPTWRIVTDKSQIVIHVQPAGLFSPALHAHHFEPAEWHGTLTFDPGMVEQVGLEVVVNADSLQDHQPALSEDDHETVARQVRSEDVLDVANHPEVRIVGDGVRVEEHDSDARHLRGTLTGEMTLRGVTRPIEIPFTARWSADHVRASGSVTVRQTDFGIEPYRRFLGTVAVADEVEIEFSIDAEPGVRRQPDLERPAPR